jgi:hypothetical protein
MYFSGRWQGFWEQVLWGHQAMHDLELHFADGVVRGRGRDIIGRFTFQGTYDNQGGVLMTKQYLGRHTVLYHGQYDGEGTIFGRWSIGTEWSGPFALAPERRRPSADEPIVDL